eukprot:2137537-Amphidinium_carterae.1
MLWSIIARAIAVDFVYLSWRIQAAEVADFVVEGAKFNMCQGYVEAREFLIVNMGGKGYHAPCLLWINEAIVQFALWRLFGLRNKAFEITDLTIVDGVDLNF